MSLFSVHTCNAFVDSRDFALNNRRHLFLGGNASVRRLFSRSLCHGLVYPYVRPSVEISRFVAEGVFWEDRPSSLPFYVMVLDRKGTLVAIIRLGE